MADRIIARPTARSPLGQVSLAGYLHKDTPWPIKPELRVFGKYAAVYVYSGSGEYRDASGRQQAIVAGDLILVFPDLGHRYGPETDGRWQELYLVFEGPVFDLWRASGLLDPRQPVHHLEPVDHWLRRFEAVLGAPGQVGHAPPLQEVCRLQQVLADALAGPAAAQVPQDQLRWASRACALLEADPASPLNLHTVARQLDTTYPRFRRLFTRIVGMPPLRYRGLRIIERACELMQSGDLTDKQIALELGFYDEFHFSRRFKQVTGRNPRQFRRSLM